MPFYKINKTVLENKKANVETKKLSIWLPKNS